jgi:hypothetical protein
MEKKEENIRETSAYIRNLRKRLFRRLHKLENKDYKTLQEIDEHIELHDILRPQPKKKRIIRHEQWNTFAQAKARKRNK